MKRFEIGFTLSDSSADSVIIEGETYEEIRTKALSEVSKRNGTNPWSREIK